MMNDRKVCCETSAIALATLQDEEELVTRVFTIDERVILLAEVVSQSRQWKSGCSSCSSGCQQWSTKAEWTNTDKAQV